MTGTPHRHPAGMTHLLIVLTMAAAVSPSEATPPASSAGGVAIGCLCLDGVRGKRNDTGVVQTPEGFWTPWAYTYDKKAGSSPARIFIFDRAVPAETALLGCDEIAVKAQAGGAQLLLAGALNRLDLKARVFLSTTGGPTRFQVDAKRLSAELGRVISGSQRLGGGTMQLAGARLYITNETRLLALATQLSGTLEIQAWNRTIVDATLRLPGGADLKMNLTPIEPARENVTIRLDMNTGSAHLWRAHLRGAPTTSFRGQAVTAGPVTLADVDLSLKSARVTAADGQVTAVLNEVAGTCATAALPQSTVTTTFVKPEVQWQRSDAAVTQSMEGFTLDSLSLTNAVFRSPVATIRTATGTVAIDGPAEAILKRLAAAEASGAVAWIRPTVPALAFMLPTGSVERIDVNISGALDNPKLTGTVTASHFAVGPLAIAHPLPFTFDLTGGEKELRIPVRFAAEPLGASLVVRSPDQSAAITATLTKAALNGEIVLTWPHLPQSRFEVPADGLTFALANTIATKPLLAGIAPAFGATQVTVTNPTPIVAAEQSRGNLTLTSEVLVLGQPVLRIGEKGKESASSLTLNAIGGASTRFDLATGKMTLLRGKFKATDIDFTLLDPTGSIDLSGMVLTSPRVKAKEFTIDIDEEQQPKTATAAITGLSITCSRVARPPSPGETNEVTFDAVPAKPLTIAMAEASRTSISDTVTLQAIAVHSLDCDLREASAHFGGGIEIRDANLKLSATSMTSIAGDKPSLYKFDGVTFHVTGRLASTGRIHVNGDTGFQLSFTVNGPSNHLNGSGTASVGAFSGSFVTSLPIEAACALNLPLEFNLASGGAEMQVTIVDGAFDARANVAPLAMALHSTSGASCDTPPEEHIIAAEKEAWTNVPCIPEVWKTCKLSVTIPKVAIRWHKRFEIHALAGTALLTNPRIALHEGGLQVCNLGVVAIAGPPGGSLVLGGVSPQMDTAFPDADRILNPFISGLFTALESLTATTLANGVGIFASTLATDAGNLSCLPQ